MSYRSHLRFYWSFGIIVMLILLSGCAIRGNQSEILTIDAPSSNNAYELSLDTRSITFTLQNLTTGVRLRKEPHFVVVASSGDTSTRTDKKLIYSLRSSDRLFDELVLEKSTQQSVHVRYKGIRNDVFCEELNIPNNDGVYGVWEDRKGLVLDNNGYRGQYLHRPPGSDSQGANARAPFFFTKSGFGVYVPTALPLEFDFTTSGKLRFCLHANELEYYLFIGNTPKEIFNSYARVAGSSLVPPLWGLGPHFWRDDWTLSFGDTKNASERIKEDIAALTQNQIAITGLWIDRPYGTGRFGWGNFDFNQEFPQIDELIRELTRNNIHVMVWIANRSDASMLTTAIEKKFLYSDADTTQWPALAITDTTPYLWLRDALTLFVRRGISGFKIDRGDEEEMPTEHANAHAAILPRLAAEACAQYSESCFNLSRNAADTARQYTAIWSGDARSTWEGLRRSVIHGLRSGLILFPLWGSDTGGYRGAFTPELLIRWIQFSACTPVMEIPITHGKRVIWRDFGSEVVDTLSRFTRMHVVLSRYILHHAEGAHVTGVPIMRPLFVDYPEEEESWRIEDEFLFGDQILVAPIMKPHVRSRRVYLPKGKWISAIGRRKVYEGPRWITVKVTTRSIPLYIRGELLSSFPESNVLFELNR